VNVSLLAFCLRSLYREYGAAFLARVVFAHPVAAVRGMVRYWRGWSLAPDPWPGGDGSLVGIGFCMKPLSPACPSGRPNHRCRFFDDEPGGMAPVCRDCLVRITGKQALASGSAFYVMTSARDILHDVLLPALLRGQIRHAVLVMCRYSFEPMRLALAICGIKALLFPFLHGDCRDYATWRRADVGDKLEQTLIDESSLAELMGTLSAAALPPPAMRFERVGNIYEPRPA
jgi:hypothetical protein